LVTPAQPKQVSDKHTTQVEGLVTKSQTPNQNQATLANPEVKGIRKPETHVRGKELEATKADRKVGGSTSFALNCA